MNKLSKKLISLVTLAVVSSGLISPSATSANTNVNILDDNEGYEMLSVSETKGIYATNPDGKKGVEKTISIDGDFSDWSEDMLIAQGAACDTATRFKGCWENWVMDTYSVYGAYDDENIYVGWQQVNTYDTFWQQDGNGPLSDSGKPGDSQVFIALDTGKGNAMTGNVTTGGGIWGNKIQYETRVDNIIAIKSNLTPKPTLFKGNADGLVDYSDENLCTDIAKVGIEVKKVDDCFPSKIMGVWNPGDENCFASYDLSSNWVDLKTTDLGVRKHDTSYDIFYEMKIPYSAIGITKEDVESEGVGVMQIISRGESGMDCVPHDPSMLDNVYENYASEPSNSHEKDDLDKITVDLAKIGGKGEVIVKPKINSFSADQDSPQYPNKTVKFTTEASGGTGSLKYQYEVNGEVVQDYSSKSTFNWTPSKAGNYSIKVTVKDSNNKTASKTMEYIIKESPSDPIEITSFKGSVDSPVTVNNSVKFTASAEGGKGTLKYKFEVNGETVKSYSTTKTYTWIPEEEGTYEVKVYVKDTDGQEQSKTLTYKVNKEPSEPIKITSLKGDVASPIIVGKSVKFTASAEGGNGTLKYEYEVDGEVVRSYSTTKTYTWIPEEEGTYKITVNVKDADGQEVSKNLTYTVNKLSELNISSFKTDLASPQMAGTSIKMGVKAEGTSLKYRFVVLKDGKNVYTRAYSTNNTARWTPKEAGTYTLITKVKDSTGKEVSAKIENYVVKISDEINIKSITTDLASPQYAGKTIKVTADATCAKELSYRFWEYDTEGNWNLISGYSSNKTVNWTPKAAGKYILWVDVKDSTGKVKSKFIDYVVSERPTIIDQCNNKLVYEGKWTGVVDKNYFNSGMRYTKTSGSKVTMNFKGTGVRLISSLGNNKGIAKIIVDGKVYSADLYSKETKYQQVAFELLDLANGNHTITVQYTGVHSSASTGNVIIVDGFEVVNGNII